MQFRVRIPVAVVYRMPAAKSGSRFLAGLLISCVRNHQLVAIHSANG